MIGVYIAIGFVVCFLISHFILIGNIFKNFFGRLSLNKIDKTYDKNPIYDDYRKEVYEGKDFLLNSKYEEVSITSYDNLKLVGYYYDFGFKRSVVFFHGFHSDPFLLYGTHIKDAKERGYNALIVDQRAHNKSEGKYSSYGKYESKDIVDWVRFVKEELKQEKVVIYGTSMGATAIMLASPNLDKNYVSTMVLDCGYTSIDLLIKHLVSSKHIPSFMFMSGVKFLAKHLVKLSFDEFYTPDVLKNTQIPAYFVSGTLDSVVTEEFLMNNYNACVSRKQFLLIEGAVHTTAMIKGGKEAFDNLYKFINEGE